MIDWLRTHLARKTTSQNLIPEIDGFRFFAIGTVLLYHLNTHISRVMDRESISVSFSESPLYRIASEGGIGVNVFFAISGFILALPFARHHLFNTSTVSLKSYYIRRLTRLEPPYVISLIVFLFVHVWILHEQWGEVFPNFLASLFYVHSFVYNEWSKINPVAWSLEVEVQFYVLAPFLAGIFAIKRSWLRRMIMILIVLVGILHYNLNYSMIEDFHLRKSLFMHLHQFMIGFLFADFFLTDWKDQLAKKSFLFDGLGFAALTLLLVYNDPFNIQHDLFFSVALFISFIGLFRGKLLNAFFTNTWVVIIGGMCYSIYLLHYALIAFLADRTDSLLMTGQSYEVNFLLQFVVIIPIVLMVSAVYFVLIERPCMDKDWPRKLVAHLKLL